MFRAIGIIFETTGLILAYILNVILKYITMFLLLNKDMIDYFRTILMKYIENKVEKKNKDTTNKILLNENNEKESEIKSTKKSTKDNKQKSNDKLSEDVSDEELKKIKKIIADGEEMQLTIKKIQRNLLAQLQQ